MNMNKPKLTSWAEALLNNCEARDRMIQQEQERERHIAQANITSIPPHAFPPREVKAIWPACRGSGRDFESQERSYHGVLRTQEAGNLTHDLTCLIKSRK